METDTALLVAVPPAPAIDRRRSSGDCGHISLSGYWALTKPEVNFLIVIATLAGFYLGSPGRLDHFAIPRLIHTLLGTLLVASGSGALNQYIERGFDAQMRRTQRRPLTVGRMEPSRALWFGTFLSLGGIVYLTVAVNLLASLLAALTLLSYLFLYTPLKRKTPLCVLVGALPGAMPPLIGYAAGSGTLHMDAWMLYLILFLWQFPHFMAIAWMYREDYDRAGYLILPRAETRRVPFVALQTIMPLVLLLPVSLAPELLGRAELISVVAISALGLAFLHVGIQFLRHKSGKTARRLLFASILYLPAVLAVAANALRVSVMNR